MSEPERTLRRLALSDEALMDSILRVQPDAGDRCWLDQKTEALVRLGAVVSLDSAPASYQWIVESAFAAGATDEEVVGTLMAVAPATGLVPVVRAARLVALAMGHDTDEALESLEQDADASGRVGLDYAP